MSNKTVKARIRRGVILGIVITVVFLIMGLTHVGEAFALEPRVYGYVIFSDGEIEHVAYLPTYLYLWRVSTLLFTAWVLVYVAYTVKPAVTLDSSGIIYGAAYVITHYAYLLTIGAPVTLYPFVYVMKTIGAPLPYLDWGQIVALITIWRVWNLRRLLREGS